jgi:hypothetical protein
MLTSARSRINAILQLRSAYQPPSRFQTLKRVFAIRLDLFGRFVSAGDSFTNEPVLLHDRIVVASEISREDLDFLYRQDRHDLLDLLRCKLPLKVGNNILHGDSAGRQLWPSATIYDVDAIVVHFPFLERQCKSSGSILLRLIRNWQL